MYSNIYSRVVLSISILILGGLLFSFPSVATAQSDFVTCSGPDCGACDLLDMIQTIVFWLATVFTIIAIGIVMYAGFKLATSGGNMTAKDDAKALLINGLIGLVIVLAGWFIVDTIMKILLNDGSGINYGMWHEVSCGGQPPVSSANTSLRFSADELQAMSAAELATNGFDNPNAPSEPIVPPSGTETAAAEATPIEADAGGNCFPGPNGVYDGNHPGGAGDDVCLELYDVEGADYALPNAGAEGYEPPPGYFGPEAIAANPQLTENFRLCDLTNCNASQRQGEYVYVDPEVAVRAEQIRSEIGPFSVNSGYRSPGYNRSLRQGSDNVAENSRHQYGDAIDIQPPGGRSDRCRVVRACRSAGAGYIMTYSGSNHVHCDWGPSRGENTGC